MVGWILTAKVAAFMAGAAFVALATKLGAPLAAEVGGAWLRPPYLYVIVNGIIISIAASSRFHNNNNNNNNSSHSGEDSHDRRQLSSATSEDDRNHHQVSYDRKMNDDDGDDDDDDVVEVKEVIKEGDEVVTMRSVEKQLEKRTDYSWEQDIMKLSTQKPLTSSPTFAHRKPAKPITPRQGGLRSKQVKHETLENTWKAITEGRSTPLSRQMKKCETWDNHNRQITVVEVGPPVMKKSETFKDRTNQKLPGVTPRKEPSLSQDELNKRVEAFIKKVNEDMRLQRQESLNQYMDMINRGAH